MIFKAPSYGIQTEYTFYQDFQIADRVSGKAGVDEFYSKVKQEWVDNPAAWGEVSCALNWRCWDLAEVDEPLARHYEKLWMESQDLAWKRGSKDKAYAKAYFDKTD